MLKEYLACLVSGLLLIAAVSQPAAAQHEGKQAATVETIQIQVAKLGVGEKAKATVTLKDGTKRKGYISQAGEDDFVLRDWKTDAPTTVRYTDVARVEANKGHSTARNIAIGVGVGVGAVLGVLAILIASLDD